MKTRTKHTARWWGGIMMLGLALLGASAAAGREMDPDALVGTWVIEKDGEASYHIEVSRCGDRYCGRIVWLRDSDPDDRPRRDEKNPDAALRERPLLGLQILSDYEHEGANVWGGGQLYAFEKGRTVSPQLVMIDENHLRVQVKILFFKKTFSWRRLIVDEPGERASRIPVPVKPGPREVPR